MITVLWIHKYYIEADSDPDFRDDSDPDPQPSNLNRGCNYGITSPCSYLRMEESKGADQFDRRHVINRTKSS